MAKKKSAFRKFQEAIDMTPELIKISEVIKKHTRVRWSGFLLFFLAGLFGLFVPILQGIVTIMIAFSFLGIKWLNRFLKKNQKLIMNITTIMFFALTVPLFILGIGKAFGLDVPSLSEMYIGAVQFGKPQINAALDSITSKLGFQYTTDVQQTLSIVDFNPGQGFSVAGMD